MMLLSSYLLLEYSLSLLAEGNQFTESVPLLIESSSGSVLTYRVSLSGYASVQFFRINCPFLCLTCPGFLIIKYFVGKCAEKVTVLRFCLLQCYNRNTELPDILFELYTDNHNFSTLFCMTDFVVMFIRTLNMETIKP